MLEQYKPLFFFMCFGLVVAFFPLILGRFIAPNLATENKLKSYECGFEPFSDARFQFDIKFYLVAILFIIFDLEMAFLFPWALLFKKGIPFEALLAMFIFLGMLFAGFIYEWKKGALEWE